MTISERSSVSGSADPTTTFTIAIPATVVTNDVLVVNATSKNHNSSTATATCTDTDSAGNAYTLVQTDAARKAYAWVKRATSATAGKTITVAGLDNSGGGGLVVYPGVSSTGTPYTNAGYEDNVLGNEAHAGFTPTNANSMLHFSIHNVSSTSTTASVACTTPGALTQRYQHTSSAGGQGGCATAAWSVAQSGGPTSTGTFTWSQSDATTKSIRFALVPSTEEVASGTSQNPVHVYAQAGTYIVSLTVEDNDGLSSSASTRAVTVA
jgi:hypothetical protein